MCDNLERVIGFALKLHDHPEQAHQFLTDWSNGRADQWPDYLAWLEREPPQHDGGLAMMIRDNAKMRRAGTKLAEAALYTVREYDGVHRLSIAVAEWAQAIANEGDRDQRYSTKGTDQ